MTKGGKKLIGEPYHTGLLSLPGGLRVQGKDSSHLLPTQSLSFSKYVNFHISGKLTFTLCIFCPFHGGGGEIKFTYYFFQFSFSFKKITVT